MNLKRNDKVKDSDGFEGIILGVKDFEGYEKNVPGPEWSLVKYDVGPTSWTPNHILEKIEDESISSN